MKRRKLVCQSKIVITKRDHLIIIMILEGKKNDVMVKGDLRQATMNSLMSRANPTYIFLPLEYIHTYEYIFTAIVFSEEPVRNRCMLR